METIQKTKLVYQDWATNSNKEYNVNLIVDSDKDHYVVCTYGRRYQATNRVMKNKDGVSYSEALRIFDKTVTEKIRKGYEIHSS